MNELTLRDAEENSEDKKQFNNLMRIILGAVSVIMLTGGIFQFVDQNILSGIIYLLISIGAVVLILMNKLGCIDLY